MECLFVPVLGIAASTMYFGKPGPTAGGKRRLHKPNFLLSFLFNFKLDDTERRYDTIELHFHLLSGGDTMLQ